MKITAFVIIDRNIQLLPYFVDYYLKCGVDDFVFGITGGMTNPHWNTIAHLGHGHYVEMSLDLNFNNYQKTPIEDLTLNKVRRDFDGWHVVADLDEFHWYNGLPYRDVIAVLEAKGYEGAGSTFIDRVAPDLQLPEMPTFPASLDDAFPLMANLTECMGANTSKVGLMKAGVETTPGHHYATGKLMYDYQHQTHHFKWTAGLRERTQKRVMSQKRAGAYWAVEGERLLLRLMGKGIAKQGLEIGTAQRIWPQ